MNPKIAPKDGWGVDASSPFGPLQQSKRGIQNTLTERGSEYLSPRNGWVQNLLQGVANPHCIPAERDRGRLPLVDQRAKRAIGDAAQIGMQNLQRHHRKVWGCEGEGVLHPRMCNPNHQL